MKSASEQAISDQEQKLNEKIDALKAQVLELTGMRDNLKTQTLSANEEFARVQSASDVYLANFRSEVSALQEAADEARASLAAANKQLSEVEVAKTELIAEVKGLEQKRDDVKARLAEDKAVHAEQRAIYATELKTAQNEIAQSSTTAQRALDNATAAEVKEKEATELLTVVLANLTDKQSELETVANLTDKARTEREEMITKLNSEIAELTQKKILLQGEVAVEEITKE